MTPDDHPVKSFSAGHRPLHFPFFIHQIEVRDRRKAVIFRDLSEVKYTTGVPDTSGSSAEDVPAALPPAVSV